MNAPAERRSLVNRRRPVPLSCDAPSETKFCRVCGCTDNRACRGGCSWVDPERDSLCSQCTAALKHVVSMTLDGEDRVGTCQCGVQFRFANTPGGSMAIDAAIQTHWLEIVMQERGHD